MSTAKKLHDITTDVERCTTLRLTPFLEANSTIAREETGGANMHDEACFEAVWARAEKMLARHTHLIGGTGSGKEAEQDAVAENVGADGCVIVKDNLRPVLDVNDDASENTREEVGRKGPK